LFFIFYQYINPYSILLKSKAVQPQEIISLTRATNGSFPILVGVETLLYDNGTEIGFHGSSFPIKLTSRQVR
jgi:hypothetical protein